MIELYHRTDAICAFKVRTLLAEKGLDWTSHLVADLRTPEYLSLNRNGYVPTLVHDDRILIESRIISEYLDDAFPEPALTPVEPWDRYRARTWTKQIDDSLHLNIFILSFAALDGWGLGRVSEADRQRRLPKDPVKRDITTEMLRDGPEARWLPIAIDRFQLLMRDMEAALTISPWLAGDRYSLADVDLTAYVYRLHQMRLSVLWENLPRLSDWYDRVRNRPSFEKGITSWLTAQDQARYDINAEGVKAATIQRMAA